VTPIHYLGTGCPSWLDPAGPVQRHVTTVVGDVTCRDCLDSIAATVGPELLHCFRILCRISTEANNQSTLTYVDEPLSAEMHAAIAAVLERSDA